MIENKLPESEVHKIIKEACEIECLFAEEITPTTIGINKKLLSDYARFIADDICLKLNYNTIYNTQNPFPFMMEFTFERKVDFFKKKGTQYSSFVEEEFDMTI
jgi:ribonucleoside-diphosphate reductase beta chain